MSDIESMRAKLELAKAKYKEAATTAMTAEQHAGSLQIRLATVYNMLGSILALDPAMREKGPSLVDDFTHSVSDARTGIVDAHKLLTEAGAQAGVNTFLTKALSDSDLATNIALVGSEEQNNGVTLEAGIATRLQEAFETLRGVHGALGNLHTEVVDVEVDGLSWPTEIIGQIVSNVEVYQQDL